MRPFRVQFVLAVLFCVTVTSLRAATPLPFVNAKGTQFVDNTGKAVILKGCNLGNWFIIELWMFGGCIEARDQAQLFSKLEERFGKQQAFQLMETYRSSWITPRDFEMIKSFGFNVVRLPIDYRLLQEDSAPYAMKEPGFKWLDHAVEMAESAGIYIVLDLHSAPGGQSNDQCTGESGQNKLWNSPVNQHREADIWRAIAKRYRSRSNVAGYDIMNEPYADHHMDVKPELRKIMADCYSAIRETGDLHVMFFPGALGSPPTFYGDPHTAGWTNVGFTEHFYPGLFGDKPVFESHIRTLTRTLANRVKWLDKIQTPYYIGEFNPVLDESGGTRATRAYYDAFAKNGWAGTLWSYKLVKPQGGAGSNTWYCVSNGAQLPRLDLNTSSYDEFNRFFAGLATVPLAVNQPLMKSVTDPNPEPLPLAASQAVPGIAPVSVVNNTTAPAGWTTVDIGQNPGGAVTLDGEKKISIIAAGMDVFGQSDSFRFVSRPAKDATDVAVRLHSLLESDEYAKAGIMARWGNSSSSTFVMVNAFPDGTIAAMSRASEGGTAKEVKTGSGSLPVDLRLTIENGKAVAMYRRSSAEWTRLDSLNLPGKEPYRIGLAVDCHSEESLTKAEFEWIDADTKPLMAGAQQRQTLLKNGSFETAGSKAELAEGWTISGDWLQRETAWTPTHAGSALMGYHHWEATSAKPTELSQDVQVQPGQRYHFSIFALRDDPKGAEDVSKIELRLEGKIDGHPVILNSTTMKASDLGMGDKWSQLSVDSTAIGDSLRAVVILTPAAHGARGGAIKLDDASLYRMN